MRKSALIRWSPLAHAVAIALAIGPSLASDSGPANFNPKPTPGNSGNANQNNTVNQDYINSLEDQLNILDDLIRREQVALDAALALQEQMKVYSLEYFKLDQHGLSGRAAQSFAFLSSLYTDFNSRVFMAGGVASQTQGAVWNQVTLMYDKSESLASIMNDVLSHGTGLSPDIMQPVINSIQSIIARATAAEATIQAQIDAANGVNPAPPNNQASSSPTPGEDAADAVSLANAVADAGGEADNGGD